MLERLRSKTPNKYYRRAQSGEAADYSNYPKFRGIDPLVQTERGLVLLTALDCEFHAHYDRLQQQVNAGHRFIIL